MLAAYQATEKGGTKTLDYEIVTEIRSWKFVNLHWFPQMLVLIFVSKLEILGEWRVKQYRKDVRKADLESQIIHLGCILKSLLMEIKCKIHNTLVVVFNYPS